MDLISNDILLNQDEEVDTDEEVMDEEVGGDDDVEDEEEGEGDEY